MLLAEGLLFRTSAALHCQFREFAAPADWARGGGKLVHCAKNGGCASAEAASSGTMLQSSLRAL